MVQQEDAKLSRDMQEKVELRKEVKSLVQSCCNRLDINASDKSLIGLIGTGREGSNFSAILVWIESQYPTQTEQRSLILEDLVHELLKVLQRNCPDYMFNCMSGDC